MNGLLERKKGSLCIFIGLCAVSLSVILLPEGMTDRKQDESYAVSIRHYGVDAREMERGAAIPLEDALYSISGVQKIQSSSENSLARVYVRFKSRRRGQYEAVREAAQKVYETLPPSAQRPEIQSSDNSRIPVWSAAVYDTRGVSDTAVMLERILKPRLEGLEGAGEVLISGSGIKEIIVAVDQEKAAVLGLDPSMIALVLGMNDALFPGGVLIHGGREITVTVDTRYGSSESQEGSDFLALGNAFVSLGQGRALRISEIASVYEQERMPDTLSRLNGQKTAVVSIMGNAGADLRKLSRDIKRELDADPLPLVFTVLSDRGAEETTAFKSVFSAAVQGACMVAIICFLLNRSENSSAPMYSSLFSALSVPAICLISAALLSASGFSMNSFVLGGIAAGVGSAVDPVILLSEKLRRCRDYSQARKALPDIRGPLVAGAATTVAALLPLLGLETGADPVVWTIGAVTLTALVLSLSIAPPLLLWDIGRPRAGPRRLSSEIWRKAQRAIKTFSYLAFRIARRCLAVNVRLCVRHPVWICIAAFVLTSGGIIALVVRGTDSGAGGSEDSVYGHIEFDGGLLAVETDRRLAVYGQALAEERGIVNVQTGARTGTGSLLISFDPKQINADKARTMARSIPIPGGFLFFPETSANERHWEIKISGDDDRRCRELAEVLARSCAALPKIGERVLNFKDGSKRLKLAPKREILSHSGISFMRAADTMRRGVHGPVAYKRIGTSGETDVRIRIGSGDAHTAEQAGYLPDESVLPGLLMYSGDENAKPLRMDSLLNREEGLEPSSIRREDRRRTASITVSTIPVDPRRVKAELKEVFEKMELPPGYSVEFDPEAIKKAQKLSGTFLSFLLALAFCYMVIASVNESFSVPLAVLSAVPPSLAVPALCIAIGGRPFNSAAACAFVAVSGMAVNASVLCAAGLRPFLESKQRERSLKLYLALRRRIPALFATTLTTVAGALPFLLLREGSNNLVRTLSLVTSLGVGSSCFCSISIVPAISLILKKITFFSGK